MPSFVAFADATISSFSLRTNRIIILSCDLVEDGDAPDAAAAAAAAEAAAVMPASMAVADELVTTVPDVPGH